MAVLSTSPWRRAHRLIWRQPAVVAAVAGGVLVLTAAAAATPLFLSSSRSAVQQRQVENRCRAELGITLPQVSSRNSADRVIRKATDGVPGVNRSVATSVTITSASRADSVDDGSRDEGPADDNVTLDITLMTRDGALDHIERLAEWPGGGDLWIDEMLADHLDVGPGDPLLIGGSSPSGKAPVVAGVYRSLPPRLATDPFDPYWCGERSRIVANGYAGDPPPLLVLADDREAYDRILGVSGDQSSSEPDTHWLVEPTDDVTRLDRAEATLERLAAIDRRVRQEIEGGQDRGTAARVDRFRRGRSPTELEFVVQRSRAVVQSVGGSIGPVTLAALATAAILVAAAGSYWVDRRRDELTMLGGRGVGPAAIGVKAALELAGPAALGGIAGLAVAVVAVRQLGPSSTIEEAALRAAVRNSGMAVVAALFVLGAVAAIRSRRLGDQRSHRSRRLSMVPWEVAPLAAAALAYRRAGLSGVPVARGVEVAQIDVLALAFPLLFIVGVVALAARLLGLCLRALRRRGSRLPTSAYLAARRLAAAPGLVLVLMAASATAIGTLAYSAQLTSSLDATLLSKSRLSVGSDVAASVSGARRPPAEIEADTTVVEVLAVTQLSYPQADIIGVDPDTFSRSAAWDPLFSDSSLATLLDRLRDSGEGPVKALVVNGPVPVDETVDFAPGGVTDLPFEGFTGATAFPGMGSRTLLVIDRKALDRLGLQGGTEFWTRGDPDRIAEAYDDRQVRFLKRRDRVIEATSFASVQWTFGYLRALGLTLALIGVGGLALYLDTRQRQRLVAYAFLRRMGLSRRGHRRSVLMEVAVPLVSGYLVGTGLAALAGKLILDRIDPVPSVAPEPVVRYPLMQFATVGAVTLIVCWAGAWMAQRAADRASSAEVLRLEV